MGVDVAIETERSERIETVYDPHNYFAAALCLPGLESSASLRTIDLYGDTVFNRLQIPLFISELEAIRDRVTDEALRVRKAHNLEQAKAARYPPEAMREFELALERVTARQVVEQIDAVLRLARKTVGEVHTYLKCYGD